MTQNLNGKTLYIAIIFSLGVFIFGVLIAFVFVYKLNFYEKFWSKGILFQLSTWIVAGYSIGCLFPFWLGAEHKKVKNQGKIELHKFRAFLFGILQILIIAKISQLHPIVLITAILIAPILFGMASCTQKIGTSA